MSTLAVVEEILHETLVPMTVREIVDRAGARLPSKSKTPETVVARDLAMDIKKNGESSLFVRSSPGRYTLRSVASSDSASDSEAAAGSAGYTETNHSPAHGEALARKPPAAAGSSRPVSSREPADGGGYAG